MAERKEAQKGKPLSKTAAAREAAHMRKAVTDRNRRRAQIVNEEQKRQKQLEKERKAQELQEAKAREDAERERLRQERAQNNRTTRSRSASARRARSRSYRDDSPPEPRVPLNPPLSSGTESASDFLDATVTQRDPPVATLEGIQEIVSEGVRPRPRMNRNPHPIVTLIETMNIPGANAQQIEFHNAIIENQLNLAQQNRYIWNAIQNMGRVRKSFVMSLLISFPSF